MWQITCYMSLCQCNNVVSRLCSNDISHENIVSQDLLILCLHLEYLNAIQMLLHFQTCLQRKCCFRRYDIVALTQRRCMNLGRWSHLGNGNEAWHNSQSPFHGLVQTKQLYMRNWTKMAALLYNKVLSNKIQSTALGSHLFKYYIYIVFMKILLVKFFF